MAADGSIARSLLAASVADEAAWWTVDFVGQVGTGLKIIQRAIS